jgi:hypothetical protein
VWRQSCAEKHPLGRRRQRGKEAGQGINKHNFYKYIQVNNCKLIAENYTKCIFKLNAENYTKCRISRGGIYLPDIAIKLQ